MVINAVGHLAEAAWHHPEIAASYAWVEVRLQNHSAKGITDKDFELARKIEDVVAGSRAARAVRSKARPRTPSTRTSSTIELFQQAGSLFFLLSPPPCGGGWPSGQQSAKPERGLLQKKSCEETPSPALAALGHPLPQGERGRSAWHERADPLATELFVCTLIRVTHETSR